MSNRRSFIKNAALGMSLPVVPGFIAPEKADKNIIITGIEVHKVVVNQRGDWYFLELKTNKSLTGLGECSHAFPKSIAGGENKLKEAVSDLFALIKNQSPFVIEKFRQQGIPLADDKLKKTVFSGIEQALWDLNGKILGVPAYQLLGGKVHDKLRVYANINRATNERDSNGKRSISSFQRNAEKALADGFTAVKLAPFDEMRPLANSSEQHRQEDIAYAIRCIEAVRSTIGDQTDLLIDVHSHLNVELAGTTAKQLEPSKLYWFEEPVDPAKYASETKTIKETIRQTLAGGEAIFGLKGYAELITNQALGIVMPDVKHCGGLLECKYIAALTSSTDGILVAPHNPSGPVATAASVAVCATIPNFAILEYAFGEVPWSRELVCPHERFEKGFLFVSNEPGTGITLNYNLIKQHSNG